MGRRTILTQKEMEAFIKNPPIGFISLGAGLILPCIFLGGIIPFNVMLWLVIIGIVSILVGIVWLLCRIDFGSSNHTGSLNLNVRTRGNETFNYINHLSKTNRKVVDNSDKIKALAELNKKYLFKSYQPTQTHPYSCKTKREFDRLSVRDYFYRCVYNNSYSYEKIIECIKYNRTEYNTYLSKVSEAESLESTVTEELCKQLKVSLKKFKRREKKLFTKMTQRPPERDISIYCEITYTSPQGRNNYRNNAVFYFSDLQSIYERVKRQKAEQETKEYKIKHERSKMSASLRYDILKRDNFKCQICGATQNDGVTLHVDHIVPVSKGGKTEWSNLRTLCERCNLGKSDKSEVLVSQSPIHTVVNYQDYTLNYGKCINQIAEMVAIHHFRAVEKAIIEQLDKYDDIKDASTKHFFILSALKYLYPYRDNEECLDIIKNICDIDISNIHNLVKVLPAPFTMETPTKRAILYERENEIERAIEICNICEQHKIWDNGKKSFSIRREKLQEKINKINKGAQ